MMHIIIVEDDEDDLDFIKEGLLSVQVAEITNLRDGIDLVDLLAQNMNIRLPDVIIMDLHLPRKDGYDTLLDLKSSETHCNIPVIILTSSILHEQVSLDAGCARYYLKPNSIIEYKLLAKEIFDYLTTENSVQ